MTWCGVGARGTRSTRVVALGDLTFEEGLKKESRRCRMLFQKGCRGALCLGAPLSLGWRLHMGGLAHSSLQAPPGVADCSSPCQSESAASTPTHCSVSPSEIGAPLSSCTVHQPASRGRWFSGCAIVWDLPPPAGCRAPGRVRGATGLLLQGSEVRARVAASAVELSSPRGPRGSPVSRSPRIRLWGCVRYRWPPLGPGVGGVPQQRACRPSLPGLCCGVLAASRSSSGCDGAGLREVVLGGGSASAQARLTRAAPFASWHLATRRVGVRRLTPGKHRGTKGDALVLVLFYPVLCRKP